VQDIDDADLVARRGHMELWQVGRELAAPESFVEAPPGRIRFG
jgi:hypothetical protein